MIATITVFVLTILGCMYLLGIMMLFVGLLRHRSGPEIGRPYISVVVAARNEEDHIGTCLSALTQQDYPATQYEIIIVNDRSSDRTSDIVADWVTRTDNLRLLQVPEETSPLVGKKRALDLGIQHSRGDMILTTDADCLPKPTWIRGLVRTFTPSVGLVAGYTFTEQPGEEVPFPRRLRSIERIALAGVAAGGFGWGVGLTCTGQNLAYRKQTYLDAGGFSAIGHLRSGDDDLFIQLVSRCTSWEMRYAYHPETHVRTIAPGHIGQAIQQEKRRASKGLLYHPWFTASLIGIFSFYLLLFVTLCLSPLFWAQLNMVWIVFGIKVFLEFIFIYRICFMLGRKDLLPYFPIAEALHLPYVLLFGLWGTLGTYKWK